MSISTWDGWVVELKHGGFAGGTFFVPPLPVHGAVGTCVFSTRKQAREAAKTAWTANMVGRIVRVVVRIESGA